MMPHQPLLVCTVEELAEPWAFSALLPQLWEAFPQPPLAIRSPCLGFTFATNLHSPKSHSKKALESLRTQLKQQFESQNWLRPQRCSSPNPFHLTSRNSELNKAQVAHQGYPASHWWDKDEGKPHSSGEGGIQGFLLIGSRTPSPKRLLDQVGLCARE